MSPDRRVLLTSFFVTGFLLTACQRPREAVETVVVYTSVDQPYSEPILDSFEAETGIRVQAVYDVEAAKTTGLVNRLIAEKQSPQADVFWNSEIIQTIRLQEEGVLAPYHSPQADAIADSYRDARGEWTGMAARARVIIVNTRSITDPGEIDSIYDLLDPDWEGNSIGIAYPLFGTTATHAAALYAYLGPDKARAYFQDLAGRDVRVVDGNSVVRDMVVSGNLAFGLTDTDDACSAWQDGAPVAVKLPDQEGMGTLLIPGSVAMIKGAPHPTQARQLIDYLLSPAVARKLVTSGFSHIPLHPDLEVDLSCVGSDRIHDIPIDYQMVYQFLDSANEELREIFLR
jgi:iron(III) transport system substrate-binding protein